MESAIEREISNQYNAYEKLRSQEEDFAKQLETKYGRGELNLQTGEFTPVQP